MGEGTINNKHQPQPPSQLASTLREGLVTAIAGGLWFGTEAKHIAATVTRGAFDAAGWITGTAKRAVSSGASEASHAMTAADARSQGRLTPKPKPSQRLRARRRKTGR